MIISFKHKGLKRLFERGDKSKLPPNQIKRIEMILDELDDALIVENMDLHQFHLHPLIGDLQGFWAVTVQAQWRIIFRFEDGDAYDVDYLDYH